MTPPLYWPRTLSCWALLRVKDRGAPIGTSNRRGDLLVRLRVVVPQKLSRAQTEALEKYAVLDGGADVRAKLRA